jgi:hypothetical protein
MRTILHGWSKGTSVPPSYPNDTDTSSSSVSSIESFDIPPLFLDSLPLGQPDNFSISSLPSTGYRPPSTLLSPPSPNPSDKSMCSTLSAASSVSLLDDDLDEPPAVAIPRGRPNDARLNDAWQTFFRDALVPPVETLPALAEHFTPPSLPPPLHPAANQTVGDPFAPCPTDSFRLWSLNANGMSIKDDFSDWHSMCVNLVPFNVGAIALSEPNLDFLQMDIRKKIEDIFRMHFGSVRLVTATTCAKAPSPWKPGGVLPAVLGKWTQHVTTTSRDDLGRWVSATLSGSDGTQATVYSCYNVVKTSISNVGPSTIFAQQYQLL